MDRASIVESIVGLVRYALRTLWRSPGYSISFIVTLGLAIGANTAIFSVIYGVLLAPLPYPDAERLLQIRQPAVHEDVPDVGFSFVELDDYRSQAATIEEFVAFGESDFNVVGRGDPHVVTAGLVTSNYFDVLGMRALLGRTLEPEDDRSGSPPVIVLTHGYWNSVFGADSSVVGQSIKLSTSFATILGVLEPVSHYAGESRQEFYANYSTHGHYQSASMLEERNHRMTTVLAKLSEGATIEGARAELANIASRLRREYPDAYPAQRGLDITVTAWRKALTGNARATLLLLLGTVGLVLAVACANVANLTIIRMIRNERELAIRSALGAGDGRLRLQLLTEMLLLALAGAALGMALAIGGLDVLVAYVSRFTPRTGEIEINETVLGFTLAIGVASALLMVWAPGLNFTGGLTNSLHGAGSSRLTGGFAHRRLQRLLAVGQIALSFVLLAGSGLLLKSLVKLNDVDPGFRTESVLKLRADNYTRLQDAEQEELFRQVMSRTRRYPGVEAVAMATWAPLDPFSPHGRQFVSEATATGDSLWVPLSSVNGIGEDYFEVLGMRLVRGRAFTDADDENAPEVAIVNESLARLLYQNEDPLGRRFRFGQTGLTGWKEIVGVVTDTREHGIDTQAVPTVYLPRRQWFAGNTMIVSTSGDPQVLARFMSDVFHELDPERPITGVKTIQGLRSEKMAPWKLNAVLFGSFAALALVIATVGVFGVLAFSVSQRTNEIGIRMAFGAVRQNILRMILGEGLILTVLGLALGLATALVGSRVMEGLLFQVEPVDPGSLLGAGVTIVGVAIGAALLPALRATRVDPTDAMRSE